MTPAAVLVFTGAQQIVHDQSAFWNMAVELYLQPALSQGRVAALVGIREDLSRFLGFAAGRALT